MPIFSPSGRDHDWRLVGGLDVIRRWVVSSGNENETLKAIDKPLKLSPVVCLASSFLAFAPPVPATQRPRLHIQPRRDRRPVRPIRRPHPQPLTLGVLIGAERKGKFPQNSQRSFSKKEKQTTLKPREGAATCSEATVIWQKWSRTPLHRLYERIGQ